MSKIEKLINRLLSNPKDFTFDELAKVLSHYGFEMSNKGKTSGSRVKFLHRERKIPIIIHKPHPSPTLKAYTVKQVITELKKHKIL